MGYIERIEWGDFMILIVVMGHISLVVCYSCLIIAIPIEKNRLLSKCVLGKNIKQYVYISIF